MDDLSKMKMKRNIALISIVLVLFGLIAYSVLYPNTEDEEIDNMKNLMMSRSGGNMSDADKGNLRSMLKKMSPSSKKKLMRAVMLAQLEKIREEVKDLSEEDKRESVNKIVVEMRGQFDKMSSDQRRMAREKMNTPEGKEKMKEGLDFFYEEFTPSERQLFDPVIEELTIQMSQ